MGLKTGGNVSVHTLHCKHMKSDLILPKRVGPCVPVMMDNSAPTHEKGILVKTYKNVLLRKRTMVAKVCRETFSKKRIKSWSRKMAIYVKIYPVN